ncbi:MAG: EI24 domain-containing protein [Pseudomonadota bacterium]
MALIGDFTKALAQLLDRRFLLVLAQALGLTVALLMSLAAGAGWLIGFLPETVALPLIGEVTLPLSGLGVFAVGAVLAASTFLMIPVAAAFVGLFLETVAEAVERRHYPGIVARTQRGWRETIGETLLFALALMAINIAALAVYLLAGPLAPLLFYALNGYLLGREYFMTVAARHLPMAEARRLRRRFRWRVWLAGTVMAVPLTVPVLNLVIPVLGVATFTHQFHRLRARAAA